MSRLCGLSLAGVFVVLFAAAAAAAPQLPKPRTIVASSGPVYAFAQSPDALAWIGADGRVRMKRLPSGKAAVIGKVDQPERASGSVLAVAATRALWAWDSGGNSNETSIAVGGLGLRQSRAATLEGGGRNIGDGRRFAGLSGGSTLAFGWVDEGCDAPFGICEACEPLGSCPLLLRDGGVSLVTPGSKPVAVPRITPPAVFAAGDAFVAVAPARTPTPPADPVPRVADGGGVEVFDVAGRLLTRITMDGLVRGLAVTGHKVTVLLERPAGERQLTRFDARTGAYLSGSPLLSPAATGLATSTGGIVFRSGRQIYLLRGRTLVPVARATATPVGLSIAGRRIAWAETVHGHGVIREVTVR